MTGPEPAGGLRLVPVPPHEPPYDDELAAPPPRTVPTAGGLALVLPLPLPVRPGPLTLPAEPEPEPPPPPPRRARPLSLAPPPGHPHGPYAGLPTPERPTRPEPPAGPPPAAPWTARLVQALLEVVAGRRPVAQLARWTTEEVYLDLSARAARTRRAGRRGVDRVRTLRVSSPVPGVVEAAAVLARGERCAGLAVRLEAVAGRWVCTAVCLG